MTTIDTPALDAQTTAVGARIRAMRRTRGMTLVQLAAAAELSHPFLSQLERGLARPSMPSLQRIAHALGSSQVELLTGGGALAAGGADGTGPDGASSQPAVVAVPAGEGARGAYGFAEARMLTSGVRPFQPIEIRGANDDPGEAYAHPEDEFLHVVEGRLRVELDGVWHDLGPGDSIYYAGGTAHRWAAIDADGYRLFVVKETPVARR